MVDILLSMVNIFSWIIKVPGWVIQAAMFIATGFVDLITLAILWLNPITLIKGILKLMIFMVKLIFMSLIGLVTDIGGTIGESILNNLKGGLWGVPHGPEQHLEHSEGNKAGGRFNTAQFGLYGHHHKHGGSDSIKTKFGNAFGNSYNKYQFDYVTNDEGKVLDKDGNVIEDPNDFASKAARIPVYHPMRCYRGIGANGYLNIVAMILCPPLGVFMSYGLKGILKILICAGLTLIYYFPGLIYGLLITTHLGIGTEIDTSDCGGEFGGLMTQGCPKRKNEVLCNEATIHNKKDVNGKPMKACYWKEDSAIKEGGRCFDLHFRYDDYLKLNQQQLNPEIDIDDTDRFNIDGNTYSEKLKYGPDQNLEIN